MEGSPADVPAPPAPAVKQRTVALLGIASLFCAAAAATGLLPWHIDQLSGEEERAPGTEFVEGILVVGCGALGGVLFLVSAIRASAARGRLAGAAALLAFVVALAPLELYARSAWKGARSVLVLGAGYSGWGYGLYAALAAGFLAAALGAVGASDLLRPAGTVRVRLRRPRRGPAS